MALPPTIACTAALLRTHNTSDSLKYRPTSDYHLYCSLIQDTRYKRQSVNCCTHCVSLIQADTLRTTAWPTTRELLQVADRDRRSASERQTCRSIRTASVYSGCPLNVGRPLTGRALTRLTVLYYWPTALIALCRLTVYYWSAAINT